MATPPVSQEPSVLRCWALRNDTASSIDLRTLRTRSSSPAATVAGSSARAGKAITARGVARKRSQAKRGRGMAKALGDTTATPSIVRDAARDAKGKPPLLRHVPDQDGGILAGRGEPAAVGAEGDGVDRAAVALQAVRRSAGVEVPDQGRPLAAAGQPAAVGAERQAP